jgi:hypothetical protein
MSGAPVGPPTGARATNHDEIAIEPNGCTSKDEQGSSNGHAIAIDDITITKAIPDKVFQGAPDTAVKLASDPIVDPGERDNLHDKEVLICFLPSP